MKKVLIAAAAAMTTAGMCSAQAADLSPAPYYKAAPAPMVAAAYNWSGLYLGINGGWGNSHYGNFEDTGVDASGGTVGGQIGYRWQAANWVFGVEAQGNWADFSKKEVASYAGLTETVKLSTDGLGLFTGQVGVAFNNVLLYAKGGGAVVRNKLTDTVNYMGTTTTASLSETRWGGVAGVGVDWGFAQNWTLGVEYNHIFLSADDNTDGFVGVDQNIDMVTARLNYKF